MTFLGLIKEAAAIASAVGVLLGLVWWLVKPRVVEWFRAQLIRPVQETHQSVTVNGHVSEEPTLRDQVDTLAETAATNSASIARVEASVGAVADELADHGNQSRAAMAIYRKALADQGVHLPVAPGEDGHGVTERHHDD